MTSEKSVYNQLNRMLSSPKPGGGTYTYQNDVLGNRTWRNYGQSGVQRYIWDEVNRLKSLCGTSEGARYEYRADGMRVKKITGLTIEWVGDEYSASGYYDENLNQDLPTVRYFYDGQMPMEEDSTYKENSVSVRDYTQYGLGARGIDYIRNVHHSSGASVVFPIYDGHGNMVYTLSRAANETFSLGNKRIYGAWGDLRHDGNPNAGPNTQYCANLGHKKDNESGLTYMRARYYEPWTGRFISEDPAQKGLNWYVYANSTPTHYADPSGRIPVFLVSTIVALLEGLISGLIDLGIQVAVNGGFDNIDWGEVGAATAAGIIGGLIGHFWRLAFYLTKTPAHRAAWEVGKRASFAVYFKKCLGFGSGGGAPFWRSILTCSVGVSTYGLMYSLYVFSYLDEDE